MKEKKMPKDMEAKKDVLKEMMQMAMDAMRGKNKHGMDEMRMKKVSVMAANDADLEAGLDKAKEVLKKQDERGPMEGESPEHESMESTDYESDEDEEDMEMPEDKSESIYAEKEADKLTDDQKKLMLKRLMKKA